MRKRDPNDVIDDFRVLVVQSLEDWLEVQSVLQDKQRLLRRATADAFLQAAVAWERFKSDWHIACVNRDSSALETKLREQLMNAARNKAIPERFVSLALPSHPTLDDVGELLDPQGANLGLGTYEKWRTRAGAELAPQYVKALDSWSPADRALHDAVSAIRNCVVHQSRKSVSAMNDALTNSKLATPLCRSQNKVSASGVATYLTAKTSPDMRRMEIVVKELFGLAQKLRV